VGEIRLQLAQPLMLVLCALPFRHIDGGDDNLNQRAGRGKLMMVD
jgi:hypothetical protein